LIKYITRNKYCQSRYYAGGSQPKRNIASLVLEFASPLYIRFFSLNNPWLTEYFNLMFVSELELKDTTNTTSSASYLELHPEKLAVRIV
jgi:hypothetical protein